MLVPVALETLANQTIKSASVKGADINAGIVNPIQNFAEVIAEPRLDEADAKAWYLAAAKGTDTMRWLISTASTRHTSISRKASPLMVSPRKCVLMPVWRRWTIAA
jgi:ribosomal protein S16